MSINAFWNLKLKWRLQSKHHTFLDHSFCKRCSQSSIKPQVSPHLLRPIQYMPGIVWGMWGMRARAQHLESTQSNEGSRHMGRRCQQLSVCVMIEVHKRNKMTLCWSTFHRVQSEDPPGFGYQFLFLGVSHLYVFSCNCCEGDLGECTYHCA